MSLQVRQRSRRGRAAARPRASARCRRPARRCRSAPGRCRPGSASCCALSLPGSSGAGALVKVMRETSSGLACAIGLERLLRQRQVAGDVDDRERERRFRLGRLPPPARRTKAAAAAAPSTARRDEHPALAFSPVSAGDTVSGEERRTTFATISSGSRPFPSATASLLAAARPASRKGQFRPGQAAVGPAKTGARSFAWSRAIRFPISRAGTGRLERSPAFRRSPATGGGCCICGLDTFRDRRDAQAAPERGDRPDQSVASRLLPSAWMKERSIFSLSSGKRRRLAQRRTAGAEIVQADADAGLADRWSAPATSRLRISAVSGISSSSRCGAQPALSSMRLTVAQQTIRSSNVWARCSPRR